MKILVALTLTALLTGCGGGNSGGYVSARAVADAAGCGQFKQDSQTTLYAADTGNCRRAGHYVQVDWFKDHTSIDSYRQIADSIGGSVILYGPNWAITCIDNKDDCSAFKDKLGGSLD